MAKGFFDIPLPQQGAPVGSCWSSAAMKVGQRNLVWEGENFTWKAASISLALQRALGTGSWCPHTQPGFKGLLSLWWVRTASKGGWKSRAHPYPKEASSANKYGAASTLKNNNKGNYGYFQIFLLYYIHSNDNYAFISLLNFWWVLVKSLAIFVTIYYY